MDSFRGLFNTKARRWLYVAILVLLAVSYAGVMIYRMIVQINGRQFDMKGTVVSINKSYHEITISHQPIKGYMGAMVMPFKVKEDWALGIVEPGDEISGVLVVTESSSWVEQIVIVRGHSGSPGAAIAPGSAAEPQPGDEIADFALVNQDGKPIKLNDYRGKFLLITFIYTRCPLPDYCPRMSYNFFELNNALKNDPAMYERTHLLSVSFDPEYDTPAVLREYGADYIDPSHRGNFEHWEFATGTPDEVKNIARAFGLRFTADQGQIIHTLVTALIGPDGKLVKLYKGNAWKPSDIIGDMLFQER